MGYKWIKLFTKLRGGHLQGPQVPPSAARRKRTLPALRRRGTLHWREVRAQLVAGGRGRPRKSRNGGVSPTLGIVGNSWALHGIYMMGSVYFMGFMNPSNWSYGPTNDQLRYLGILYLGPPSSLKNAALPHHFSTFTCTVSKENWSYPRDMVRPCWRWGICPAGKRAERNRRTAAPHQRKCPSKREQRQPGFVCAELFDDFRRAPWKGHQWALSGRDSWHPRATSILNMAWGFGGR